MPRPTQLKDLGSNAGLAAELQRMTTHTLAALMADAERYRWLRDKSGDCCDACGVFVDFPRVDCHRAPNKADIDYAIDLAMRQEANAPGKPTAANEPNEGENA